MFCLELHVDWATKPYFPLNTGCLIGILIMVYEIIPNWVVCHPNKSSKQPFGPFFQQTQVSQTFSTWKILLHNQGGVIQIQPAQFGSNTRIGGEQWRLNHQEINLGDPKISQKSHQFGSKTNVGRDVHFFFLWMVMFWNFQGFRCVFFSMEFQRWSSREFTEK